MKRFVLVTVVVMLLVGPGRSRAHENEGAEFYGYALGGAVIAQTLGALAGLISAPPAYYPPPAQVYVYPAPYPYVYPAPYVYSYPPPYPYPRYGYAYGHVHPHPYAAPYGSYVWHGTRTAGHGSYAYHGAQPQAGYAPPRPYAGRPQLNGASAPRPGNYVRRPIQAASTR